MNTSPNILSTPSSSSKRRSTLPWLIAVSLLALGLGLRLYDLTDQPIDFHATRQLRGALIARGMYYQMLPEADESTRSQAIAFGTSTGQYEPSILEYVVARTYLLLGQETLWVSRVFTSLFWIICGAALFSLAWRAASPGAALAVLAYYLILPFAVQASRSFQPDPVMVMWIVLSIFALYRWSEHKGMGSAGWKWAILAGIFGGGRRADQGRCGLYCGRCGGCYGALLTWNAPLLAQPAGMGHGNLDDHPNALILRQPPGTRLQLY